VSDCRRTRPLIARLSAGVATEEDGAHAATCARCGPVMARAGAFDDELRRSARALVAEELPRGILDQPLGGPAASGVISRRAAPGLAATVVALAILVLGTAVALAPGSAPLATPSPRVTPSPTPAAFVQHLRKTELIAAKLATLDYSCNDGAPVQSVGLEPDAVATESRVCLAPDSLGPFLLAVIVGEARNGNVAELTVKGDVIGDTSENRGLFAMNIAKVLAVSLLDENVGQAGGLWVKTHLPELEIGGVIEVTLRDVSFRAERSANGSYRVVVRGAPAA